MPYLDADKILADKYDVTARISRRTYNFLRTLADAHPPATVAQVAALLLDHRVASAENLGKRMELLWGK